MKQITIKNILVNTVDNWSANWQDAPNWVGIVSHSPKNQDRIHKPYARFHNWVEKNASNQTTTNHLKTSEKKEDINVRA